MRVRGQLHGLGELLDGRIAAELLRQRAIRAVQPLDHVHDVHGEADRAALVGDGARHGLADPPGGVGRELEALGVVELLDRADEAEVALLDEVEQRQAGRCIDLRDRDHEAEVALDQAALGGLVAEILETRELALLLGVEQRAVADLAHVGAKHVDGGATPLLLVVLGLGIGLVEQRQRGLRRLVDDLVVVGHEPQVRSGDDGLFIDQCLCGNGHVSVFSCPGNDGAP